MNVLFIGQPGFYNRSDLELLNFQTAELQRAFMARGHTVSVCWPRESFSVSLGSEPGSLEGYSELPGRFDDGFKEHFHYFTASLHALLAPADIVHYQGLRSGLYAWIPRLFKRSARITVSVYEEELIGADLSRFGRWKLALVKKIVYFASHALIAESPLAADLLGTPAEVAVTAIKHNQVSLLKAEEFLSHFGLEPQKYLLAITSGLHQEGTHYLIQAFQGIERSDFRLAIVLQKKCSQRFFRELEELARDDERISFIRDFTSTELDVLLEKAYLLVALNENIGVARSAMLAMAQGVSVLNGENKPANKFLGAKRIRTPLNDILGLRARLIELMASNDRVRLNASQCARDADRRFSVSAQAETIISYYEKLRRLEG